MTIMMNQHRWVNQLLLLLVVILSVINHYSTLIEGRIHKTKYPRGTSSQRQQQELEGEEAYYESVLIRGGGRMNSNLDAFDFNNYDGNENEYELRRLQSSKSGAMTMGTMVSGTMASGTMGTMVSGTMASGTMGTMVSGTMASGTMGTMASGTMASGTMVSMASGTMGTMSSGASSRRRGRRRAERQRYRL